MTENQHADIEITRMERTDIRFLQRKEFLFPDALPSILFKSEGLSSVQVKEQMKMITQCVNCLDNAVRIRKDQGVAYSSGIRMQANNGLFGQESCKQSHKIMIKTKSIRKVFRTENVETWALNDVSLEITDGEFVAIMGPSGCGKFTLLNILGLLDNSTDGTYNLNGMDVSRYSEQQRTRLRKGVIGFVFQSFNLIEELNVFENIELPLLYMDESTIERRKKVQEAMERMQIMHRAKHFPQQLSGGQQQRVAIARAVVANPQIILADEPAGNLDSQNGKEVMSLLTELHKEGTTVVMVTHNHHDANYATRIINLFDGQLSTEVKL